MKTVLRFDTRNAFCLPSAFQEEDVRFSDAFAEYFIEHFSKPEDIVFDPFAGFGTTLLAAEKRGRHALGVELLPERVSYIQSRLQPQSTIICGSALTLDEMDLSMIDFVLTSPPYMQRTNHPEYPFAGYKVTGQGYDDYLHDTADIFRQLRGKLKPNAYVVIEASNLLIDGHFTPLAWDIARSVGAILSFRQEIIIDWQRDAALAYGFGYDHSYALVFQHGEDPCGV